MEFITPPFLKKKDIIAIVAPSGPVNNIPVLNAAQFILSKGFNVELGKNIFNSYGQLSGTDTERAADFQQMLDNPDVKAIIMARGGYGSGRLLSLLNWNRFMKNPKWICGFSDGTVWHNLLHKLKIKSIHADMLKDFDSTPEAAKNLDDLLKLLQGQKIDYPESQSTLNQKGIANGILVGGNLSIINSMRGTPFDLDIEGKVLFLEEVGEYKYQIDRMFLNLALSGWFDKMGGLILGGFTQMKENNPDMIQSIEEIIQNYLPENLPVAANFPSGHLARNFPLIFGSHIRIEHSKVLS